MKRIFLAILSGLLFAFSWPSIGFFPLIFFAFVPLLILENQAQNGKEIFGYSYISFLIFNIITTYWVWYATPIGSVFAFLVNSLLMTITFYIFYLVRKNTNNRLGYLAFVFCWITFEYLHLNWDLSWPWLTLGNVFSNFPYLVQWYEFTGFLGGSFWILLVNVVLFRIYSNQNKKRLFFLVALMFLLPTFISAYLYFDSDFKKKNSLNVIVVQPNIDPYTEKFNIGYKQQLDDFISLSRKGLTQKTQLLIAPETTLLEEIWENKIEATYSVRKLMELQREFPRLNIIVGATTYKMFLEGEKTTTSRKLRSKDLYYDVYNSAIFISNSGEVEVYHKTKLVPGAEKTPFPNFLDKLANLMLDLGGTTGSLGSENTLTNFNVNGINVRPLICYESVYGEMDCDSSNLLAIITNDGWWKNTAGYKQHFSYASLRAIEQRKAIVRAANTGISALINPNGEVLEKTKWDEEVCFSANVYINAQTTFYSQFGNYIGRLSGFFVFILLMVTFVKSRMKK